MKLKHVGMMSAENIVENKPMNIEIEPNLFIGANNGYTSFPFRVVYLLWILKGANMLAPLQYYGRFFDEFTDDGESLRGAYGPRLRYWVGPDALQEAIKNNQDIDMDSGEMEDGADIVKPKGIDQLNAVYEDFRFGLTESVMQIFDPALDFDETNNVPDLHRISFLKNGDKLDMILDYLTVDVNTTLINEYYAFEMIQYFISMFLSLGLGKTYVNVGRAMYNKFANNYTEQMKDYTDVQSKFSFQFHPTPEDFWNQFAKLINFEKHLRMQINNGTFRNDEISISELSHILIEKLLDSIDIKILSDLGRCLLICAIIKHTDNISIYKGLIMEEYEKLDDYLKAEIYNYSIHTNTTFELGL